MSDELHRKYRPKTLNDVIGQSVTVRSLTSVLKRKSSRAFLLTGGSGVGKTTIARIGARQMGATPGSIVAFDAASKTGVDDIRNLREQVQFKPIGAEHKAIIVDECHRLSKNAWDALLTVIEEPPPYLSWWLCTTDPSKVPPTIKTRCVTFTLRQLTDKDLKLLMDRVCDAEQIDMNNSVGDLCIRQALGSARQLLVNIAACRDITDRKTAAQALQTVLESDPSLELCRFVISGGRGSWSKLMGICKKLEEENPEGLRILIVNYLASALKAARSDDEACGILQVMQPFASSFNPAEGFAPLFLALGQIVFSEES